MRNILHYDEKIFLPLLVLDILDDVWLESSISTDHLLRVELPYVI